MLLALNDEVIDQNEAKINPLCEGVLFGYGAFETLKVENKHPLFFEEHWERFHEACEFLNITLKTNAQTSRETVYKLLNASKLTDGYLRYSALKDGECSHLLINCGPPRHSKDAHQSGFKLGFNGDHINSTSFLDAYKHNNYLEHLLAREKIKAKGFDEGIFLNEKEILVEGCVSNLFFVKDKKLHTPSLSCGLLPGITRAKVIQLANELHIKVVEGSFPAEQLFACDEIFITNSLLEIMPASCIKGLQLDITKNPVTRTLQNAYLELKQSLHKT